MQNKTDLVGVSAGQLRQLACANMGWLTAVMAGAGGFIMARSVLFGGVSPFGAALTAALVGPPALAAALGAIAGHLLLADALANVQYIAAIVLILAAKWVLPWREKKPHMTAVAACLAGLGVSAAAVLALGGATTYDVIMRSSEVLLGCGAAYFFSRSASALDDGLSAAGKPEVSCLAIAGCVVVMALSSLVTGGLSTGRVLAVLAILICAHSAREAGGAIAGVAAGVSVALATGDHSYVIGAYGFGGLAAGLFAQFGKIPPAAAFALINTGVSLLTMEFAGANTAIFEAFAASVIFIALPQGWIARAPLQSLCTGGETDSQSALRERLEDYSAALEEIGKTTREVGQKLRKREILGPGAIIDPVAERVCADCGMKTSCWQLRKEVTVNAMNDAIAMLRASGSISREKMPRHFLQTCCRLDELCGVLCGEFNAHTARESVRRKVGKVRAVLTDQFEGMAMMLSEVASELCATRPFESDKAGRIREYFTQAGIVTQRVSCTQDRYNRVNIELVLPNPQVARLSKTKVTLDLCTLLETDFDLPEVIIREKTTTLTFCEKATYSVEMGAYQLSSGKNRICGDAYDFIRNKGGQTHFVLSDGMGSGGSAAVDSAMACGLLVKLISVGVGYDAALKMVNSALLIKSGDETLATIDVCSLDLFTGKASFYKAGAAPTFIVKGGKAGYLESTSLPAGILHGVSFEKSSVTLHEGDIVVMVSDGVTGTGADWVKSELGGLRTADMQRLCEKLAITAKMRRTDGHEDDITVLAAALRRS